jgi:SPP1 family predicted phage head-tail adaptor
MSYVLRHRVEIQKYRNTAEVGYAETKEWCFYKETFADIFVQGKGTEYNEYGSHAFTNVEFVVRYDEDLNYDCRVKYNNQIYTINHIENVDRKQWFKLQCVNLVDDN